MSLLSTPVRLWRKIAGWQPYPAIEDLGCDLCGSREDTVVGQRVSFEMKYTTVLCRNCGLVRLSPRPTAQQFNTFYESLYPQLYSKTSMATEGSERGAAVLRFLAEQRPLKDTRGVFDIGCGDGGLLRSAAEALHELKTTCALAGCDPGWPGEPGIHIHQNTKITIYKAGVETLHSELKGYTFFTLYDVLEHLMSPRAFLKEMHSILPEDAMLFISTNALDYWATIPPAGWENYYLRLAHTFCFTTLTLRRMAEVSGWDVVSSTAASKGDQWVLLRKKAQGDTSESAALAGHAADVLTWIESYKKRCR